MRYALNKGQQATVNLLHAIEGGAKKGGSVPERVIRQLQYLGLVEYVDRQYRLTDLGREHVTA